MRSLRSLRLKATFALNFAVEPRLGVGPVLLDGAFGQAQNFRGFGGGHANKETQLDDPRLDRIARGQLVEGVVDRQKVVLGGCAAMSTFSISTRCRPPP